MPETIRSSDVLARWTDIAAALRAGKHEFMIGDGRQVEAVIVSPTWYRRLVALTKREERRRRALALPLAAATFQADWDAGFTSLERISAKFVGLTDDDLDALFSEVLAETCGVEPA
ncbi:MAG: hypothetical protein NT169_13065 [Chloroflexi bacterium]|nr:hypothetical protein [Chloroflexota bacterium]